MKTNLSAATIRSKGSFSFRKAYAFNPGVFRLSLGVKTFVMGIVNATPDSFSMDGCYRRNCSLAQNQKNIVGEALRLVKEGADIIDIGGESSRPGAKSVFEEEEMRRVISAIAQLSKRVKIPISIDTYKPAVAQSALDAGAVIVNNIQGARPHKQLLKMVARYKAGIVLMHMKGTPRTMQKKACYQDVIGEIIKALERSLENCLEMGIKSDKIIIDPGIGFGKTAQDNLKIIHRLKSFEKLNAPVLMGVSRKSFIGRVLGKDAQDRLFGTAAAVSASILNGAHIVRVHDVKEIKDIVQVADSIINEKITT